MKLKLCLILLLYAALCAPVDAAQSNNGAPIGKLSIVMLGDSLTAGFDWSGVFPNEEVHNLGVSGDTTLAISARLDEVGRCRPDIVFLMAGINDFASVKSPGEIVRRHEMIWRQLRGMNPKARLLLLSLLPVSEDKYPGLNGKVRHVNEMLRRAAREQGLEYVEMYLPMANERGHLADKFTYDGLHLNTRAYLRWADIIKPYVLEMR